ncbi:MAG: SH3 domain-containing protein [Dehalococcoidia bacterium]
MPKIYGRRRWLRYWYVPAAALVSAATAYAVVLAVDAVVGDETKSTIEPAASTTVISQTPLPTPAANAASPTASATGATAAETPAAGGRFQAGQQVVVAGTGDCLNVRSDPSTDAPVIDCLPDGTALTILDGPQEAAGRTWWRVNVGAANGWAAEEYLRAR